MSDPAGKFDFTIVKGARLHESVRRGWRDLDTRAIGYYDLSAASARMQVRATAEAPNVLIEFSTANGKLQLDVEGRIEILMTPDETALIDWVSGVYDIYVTLAPDDVRRWVFGSIVVKQGVTQ